MNISNDVFQLLDCFTIPAVLVLSYLILRVRYNVLHVIGVFVCLAGVGSLVGADFIVDKYQGQGKSVMQCRENTTRK